MNERELKSLKESIDTLIDENERLRKRIDELENEKAIDPEITNIIKEKVTDTLDNILRQYRWAESKKYEPHFDGQRTDWVYRDKQGTNGRRYIEVGDDPNAPQVGDWPPGPPINERRVYPFPWWGIYPPEWNWKEGDLKQYQTITTTSNSNSSDKEN